MEWSLELLGSAAAAVIRLFAEQQYEQLQVSVQGQVSVFGCKEVGGSKEMGKYNCSLPYLSKHRKKKIRKPLLLFFFSLLHNHFLLSLIHI